MKKIILIDGNSLMFRAYYATAYTGNLMQAKNGLYTNAIYGFVNMINKIIDSESFDNIFVAFDKGKKTLRHQVYDDYKGGRKPMPEEFAMQIPLIKEYLDVLQIKRLETDDYEADDLIAIMANKAINSDFEVLVLSGDKDLLQLVNNHVTVALTKKGISELEYYTKENFKSILGFEPNQLIDYKGLIGDNSDNLPGITGVGPKTAVKLLEQYQTLENIIANVANIKGKVGEMIKQDADCAMRTKHLATLYKEAEVDLNLNDTIYKPYNLDKLRLFYEKVDFKSFIKRLETTSKPIQTSLFEEEVIEVNKDNRLPINTYINDLETFKIYTKNLVTNSSLLPIAIEVELDQTNYNKADLIGFSLLINNEGFFFEKSFIYNEYIKAFLEKNSYTYVTIDLKKVYCTFMKYDIQITNFVFDVNLASYILNPSTPNQDVKYIFDNYQITSLPYFEEIYGKKTILNIPDINIITKYSLDKCEAIKVVLPLMNEMLEKNQQSSLLYDIEMPLAIVLGKMELNGFKVDLKRLEEIGTSLTSQIKELEKQIYQAVGHKFNIGSPKQLGVILFDELNLGKGKKNKTGYATSADILEKLSEEHLVPRLVLEYRKYSKLLSTYVIGLSNEVNKNTGKVHTTFKQSLTTTGRLSSIEPNIQNIPIRSEDGRLIRSAFIPSYDNGFIVSADYSQIELRILAHVAQCQAMIDDFNHGMDFHTITASRIYDVKITEVTKDMRRIAKAVNFGIIYGMSDWGLAEQLHISPSEASMFIRRYFATYPEIKTYLEETIEKTKTLGYTQTIFNRRRYMPEINSSNHALREFAKRTAMNAPIQGAAADIIKIAMIKVDEQILNHHLKSKLVAQVHDELIIDCLPEELNIVKEILKDTMENAVSLKVKMIVDVEEGTTWDLK